MTLSKLLACSCCLVLFVAAGSGFPARGETPELAPVTVKRASRNISSPGELQPFEIVVLHAKVSGYVEKVLVDRGSRVGKGQLLLQLSAPELQARTAEAESRFRSAESDRAVAEAQYIAAANTAERIKKASQTPGAIAGNEVIQAAKQADAAQALVQAKIAALGAARAAWESQREINSYLRVTAPFAGVVTERSIHPGALVGPDNATPLLTVQQTSRLRLTVAVPEQNSGRIALFAPVSFQVPAYPGRVFQGKVARNSHSVDPATRSMPVELDVFNRDGALAPGMYATVSWPVASASDSFLVPKTAVIATSERTFVICLRNGKAQWVNVQKVQQFGDDSEIVPASPGALTSSDRVVRRGTDEIRDGAKLTDP